MSDTTAEQLLDDLRSAMDDLDEINTAKREAEARKRECESRINEFLKQTGATAIENDRMRVSVKESMESRPDPERWPDFVKWAVESGNHHLIQRRVTSRAVAELLDQGVSPVGLITENVRKLALRRR